MISSFFRSFTFWISLAAAICVSPVGCSSCDSNDSNKEKCGNGICDPDENHLNCPEDCPSMCGNGAREPDQGEECDGSDLGGATCLDLTGCTGTLACDINCHLDTSACNVCPDTCGNGVAVTPEECDGSDLAGHTCTDFNCQGGELACRAPGTANECTLDSSGCTGCFTCGNGITEGLEECDCGTNPDSLPFGCTQVNGHPASECQDDCKLRTCSYVLWDDDPCDPDQPDDQCCPDWWGNPAACIQAFGSTASCVVACSSTADCHYNNFCDTSSGGCLPRLCGPNGPPGSGDLNGSCQIPNGGSGYCMPVNLAQADIGMCIEHGGLSQHQVCTLTQDLVVTAPRDQGIGACDDGLCRDLDGDGTAHCLGFCDWVEVFDEDANDAACGTGYNCYPDGAIDPSEVDPADLGKRPADFAYCRPTVSQDPHGGKTTCDLTTLELISNRSFDCQSIDPSWTCVAPDVASYPPVGLFAPVSPIGVCTDTQGQIPTASMWGSCQAGVDICPEGSVCAPEDFCAAGAGAHRCIPFCDTASAVPCGAAHAEVPNTNVCHSLSTLYRPAASDCSTDDGSPTRLGLCALP